MVEQRCRYLSKQRSVPQDEIADRVEFVERRLVRTVNVDQSLERQMKRAEEGKLEMIDALARQPRQVLLVQVAGKLEIHGFARFRVNVLGRKLKTLFESIRKIKIEHFSNLKIHNHLSRVAKYTRFIKQIVELLLSDRSCTEVYQRQPEGHRPSVWHDQVPARH